MGPSIDLGFARRRFRLIVAAAVLTAFVAYLGSYLLSPSYSSSARVLVRARETRLLTSTGQDMKNQPGVGDATLAKAVTQTNSALLKGRTVAEEVVRDLGLDMRPADTSFVGQFRSFLKQIRSGAIAFIKYGSYVTPKSAFDATVTDVVEQLEATPIKDSYLIEVKATADEPELAAAMANSAAASLARVSQERFATDATAYRDFLKTQVDDAQKTVDRVQQEISAYKEQQGISNVAEQLKLSAGTQETIRSELRRTSEDLAAARAEAAALDREISRVNATESSVSTITTGRSSTQTSNSTPNRVYQDLVSRRSAKTAEIAGLEAREELLLIDVDARSHLLPQQEAKLNELERQLTAAVDTYRYLRASLDVASLNSAQGAVEVSQTDRAPVPLYPERPVRYLFFILGLLLGAGGGTVLAYRRERAPKATAATAPGGGGRLAPFPPPAYSSQVTTTATHRDYPN